MCVGNRYNDFGYWVGPNGEIEGISGPQRHRADAPSVLRAHEADTAPAVADVAARSPESVVSDAERILWECGWLALSLTPRLTRPARSREINVYLPVDAPVAQARALLNIVEAHAEAGFEPRIENAEGATGLVNVRRTLQRHIREGPID